MSTEYIIILICAIILISYFFDLTSKITKIPSVLMLIGSGIILRQIADWLQIDVIDLNSLFPVLGSLGLILIVFEGSLDLEIKRSNLHLIKATFLSALIMILVLASLLTAYFVYFKHQALIPSIINALPFSIISSAIAIPSSKHLHDDARHFITYESAFSDIIGVIIFNFFVLNTEYGLDTFFSFSLQIGYISILSLIACLFIAFAIDKLSSGHVKYLPIIAIIVLTYAITKSLHWPALILILVLGLFLNNIERIPFAKNFTLLNTENLKSELNSFKVHILEVTFVIRTFFFIIFGFLTDLEHLLNIELVVFGLAIAAIITSLRIIYFGIANRSLILPVAFISPRGLITILLFISIPQHLKIPIVQEQLLTIIIIATSLTMIVGVAFSQKK